MKNLFFLAVLMLANFSFAFSQADPDFVIPRNEDVTKYTQEGFKITASDVYSRLSKLKRKIEIFDANNVFIGEAYIKLESNDQKNMYDKINNNPRSFSGILSIEIDKQTVYSRKIVNGVAISARRREPVYNPNLSCTILHVHDCVAYNIEGMNWVQYTICLFTAPGCYIEQWLSCQWEVCHNHMQYTNPN